jgi:hypothetical protein
MAVPRPLASLWLPPHTVAAGCVALLLPPPTTYGDEKVANRDITVWHGATETGP